MGVAYVARSDIAALTVNLPPISSVLESHGCIVRDGAHNAGVNNITITPEGEDLIALWGGTQNNFIIDQNSASIWIGRVNGKWRVIPNAAT